MIYLKVLWKHNLVDEPCSLYSELDEDRWETRKVEIYADGTNGYASKEETCGDTKLSIEPLPTEEEIAADPQFIPSLIGRNEFDDVWRRRKDKPRW